MQLANIIFEKIIPSQVESVLLFNHSGRLKYQDRGSYWVNSELDNLPGLDTFAAGVTLKYNLQYVEIPVSLKLRSGYFGTFRVFAELPIIYLGFKTQAKGSTEGNNPDTEKENISPDVAFFNLSWGGLVEDLNTN